MVVAAALQEQSSAQPHDAGADQRFQGPILVVIPMSTAMSKLP
jgi:hypothetical protein